MGFSDRSLYSSLFRYVPTESHSPLEDFLTEAIADLLNRLLEKNGAVRKGTHSFISSVICNGCNGQRRRVLDSRLRSAKRLTFRTQRRILLDGKPKRLDLCLCADSELLLVVENKVVQTRRGAADLNADDSRYAQKVAEQLKSYARWLKENHPAAGLALLGIDKGPPDFVTNSKKYPAGFRSICHWTQIWEWLRKLAHSKHLEPELSVPLTEFVRFLEEKNLKDIDEKEFSLLQDCLPHVHSFLGEIEEKITKILKEVRSFAEIRLPQYRKDGRAEKLPVGNVRSDDKYRPVGDYAYCYERGLKDYEARLKWWVGWGFQTPEASKGKPGALQAFVCVESDGDGGTLIPLPSVKEKADLSRKGWQFHPPIIDENGNHSSFSTARDAATFLPGFSKESVDWFKKGIQDAA